MTRDPAARFQTCSELAAELMVVRVGPDARHGARARLGAGPRALAAAAPRHRSRRSAPRRTPRRRGRGPWEDRHAAGLAALASRGVAGVIVLGLARWRGRLGSVAVRALTNPGSRRRTRRGERVDVERQRSAGGGAERLRSHRPRPMRRPRTQERPPSLPMRGDAQERVASDAPDPPAARAARRARVPPQPPAPRWQREELQSELLLRQRRQQTLQTGMLLMMPSSRHGSVARRVASALLAASCADRVGGGLRRSDAARVRDRERRRAQSSASRRS